MNQSLYEIVIQWRREETQKEILYPKKWPQRNIIPPDKIPLRGPGMERTLARESPHCSPGKTVTM